ncbi:zinc finger protein 37 homolog isoform X2 [Pleuronectes platessa]|uniref:zinc finger protein 37 homolog isoform X2 n=1 Tax=Pleuronectes platessa TaxID=8262 RepID=UPI00232A2DEA|nr:zinc finger protein 37 homolog isoform X2 [Pleuronectes platessa]
MSDLDSLIVTFQTQLSDVMESVVKTAMYEVTRLVEDGFLKEVETLRMQLHWTEKKLSDREGEKRGRCVDCAKKDVELSTDAAGDRCDHQQQDDGLRVCAVKKEGSPVERWTQGHRLGVVSELPQEADNASAVPSPERESQAAEEEEVVPAVDVKEEEGKAGLESQSISERTEAQPKPTPKNSEELLRDIMTQGSQISAAFCFPEELEETHMATDPSHLPALEMDCSWTGLLLNHRVGPENDHDSAKTRVSLKPADHELPESVAADVHVQATQNATSGSSEARLQNSKTLGVKIKQEITIDSDGCEESENPEKKEIPKSGMKSFSCSLKQQRVSSEAHKRNHIYHKATVQEVVKLHSKGSTGLKLQAAIHHLNRPLKRNPHTLSNSSTAALSIAHSQVVNSNSLNRIPSTSKAAPPPPLSAQRVHLVDKQAAPLSRTGAQWVSVRSQSAIAHHTSPVPHTDSHTGPRNILRCGQCGKCFPHPSNLKAHLQTHTGERPFCCSLCGRSFTKLSNLKAHRRVHTGERPYCCMACGKRFTQKCNLKRHQRIHLDV